MRTNYSSILLPVPHIQQSIDGECLPTCAAMVLTYLGLTVNYQRLLKVLNTQVYGTPFSNIQQLATLGVTVQLMRRGTLDQLYVHLANNRPCITSVMTGDLPHWDVNILHAVVVVGMDDKHIYLNDPDVAQAPIKNPQGDFDLAWLNQDEMYATMAIP